MDDLFIIRFQEKFIIIKFRFNITEETRARLDSASHVQKVM